MLQIATTSLLLLLSALLLPALGAPLNCKDWKESYQNHCKEEEPSPLKSCCDLRSSSSSSSGAFSSGRYTLKTGGFSTSNAWCDMETDNGGWLVVLRRESSRVEFGNRLFTEYEDGFGELDGSFWYGLKAIETLTSRETYQMRVDMYKAANDTEPDIWASYNTFEVQGTDYTLKLGNFTGSIPSLMDNLMQFNNRPFAARRTHVDTTNDCVNSFKGGWWYAEHFCVSDQGDTPGIVLTESYQSLGWYDISQETQEYTHQKYEMKIRPTNC